jgi:hypothetical protein
MFVSQVSRSTELQFSFYHPRQGGNQAEVDLVGERLEVQHDPAIPSAAVAGYVAAAVLAKARLDSAKGSIIIPPHCGLELWDVLNIVDYGCNQSANYRVCGYTFEYDAKQPLCQHHIALSDL